MKVLQILFLMFFLFVFANAQYVSKVQEKPEQKMTLTGAVFDKNGAVILNAKIVAYRSDGTKFESNTDTDGIYKIELPLAVYKIEVSANGFCNSKFDSYQIVDSTYGKMFLGIVLILRNTSACKDVGIEIRKKVAK